jgi:hypothetical protein
MRSIKYNGDQIKKEKLGGSCGMYGEMCIHGCGGGQLKERDNLEELGRDRSVTLKVDYKEMGWINVVRDEYKCWAVVSTVMHACVLYIYIYIYIYVCVCVCVCVW